MRGLLLWAGAQLNPVMIETKSSFSFLYGLIAAILELEVWFY